MVTEIIERIPDKADWKENIHRGTKIALSAIPSLGGPISEIFNYLIGSPLQKRREEWMNRVLETINELRDKVDNFSVENLSNNPLFLDVIIESTRIALKTHQEEKKEALVSVIRNVALEPNPEENIILIFLRYIDELTPLHFKILKFFDNPSAYMKALEDSSYKDDSLLPDMIEKAIPELKCKKELYQKLTKDLYNEGLLKVDNNIYGVAMTSGGVLSSRTSDLGKSFINFITTPKNNLNLKNK